MRYASLLALALVLCACGDDGGDGSNSGAGKGGSHSSAGKGGSKGDAGHSGSGRAPADGGVDAGEKASKLPRPGVLPRPPKTGLPDDLRPPR